MERFFDGFLLVFLFCLRDFSVSAFKKTGAKQSTEVEVSQWTLVAVLVILVGGAAVSFASCLISHHRGVPGEATGRAEGHPDHATAQPHSPTTTPMLSVVSAGAAAGMGGMDRLRGSRAARELAASRDRQVRLHTVHTDLALNLPPSIALPDGEEHSYNTTSSRLQLRDPEQESEIYQKCIRPPPNRTVLESESPPPYRSSSAGVLASSSSSSSEWSSGTAPLVVRCHSMSSTSSSTSKGAAPQPAHHHHHHQHAPTAPGQKTDFLQRTVKIFTGKKAHHHQQPPAPTLPVVVVPTATAATSQNRHSRREGSSGSGGGVAGRTTPRPPNQGV